MTLLGFLNKKRHSPINPPRITKQFSSAGPVFLATGCSWESRDPSQFAPSTELASYLFQLEEEGVAVFSSEGLFLSWNNIYKIKDSPDHKESYSLLELPSIEQWKPILGNQGTLTDSNFTIYIAGWIKPDGRPQNEEANIDGALLKSDGRMILLSKEVWELVESVFGFLKKRSAENTSDADSNRMDWARVREKAVLATADLSNFLANTVVLTPETLRIDLRRAVNLPGNVVEVQPSFVEAPNRWIEIFDRTKTVPERYEIPDDKGITHVLISPVVRTVLQEIKKMPGRRVTGTRADAFIRNPYSALGPDASLVIDADQFEAAREAAGISFSRFLAIISRDKKGYPYQVGLHIDEALSGEVRSERVIFKNKNDLSIFLNKLYDSINSGHQCCHWKCFDLEILGDTKDQADRLSEALKDWSLTKEIDPSEVLNLSNYSDRIVGFGIEKTYYSPFIARKNVEKGWFPDNVEFGVLYTPEGGGETIPILLNEKNIDIFKNKFTEAKEEKRETFLFPECPKPIPITWAENFIETFDLASKDITNGLFDPDKIKNRRLDKNHSGLVIKPNIDTLDYEERRGILLPPSEIFPNPPTSLRKELTLKNHQLIGLRWLLHLWSVSPKNCRGALLADDMGLGKTLQILSFIACILESNPDVEPFLIVAPVALLENWVEEIEKFFNPNTFRILTLYGSALNKKRIPRDAIREELASAGITKLLHSNWIEGANLVLTTYETLRDLEFDLARQDWSAVVCDEAQKIKNPNAMVTRAAKKQKARLKIACTGTPVENTLTDLWCLFDFIQPGLLGPLNDFSNIYRKPIEAETEDEKASIEKLRELIDPQKLRRTKAEVAKDLPKKIVDLECRSLTLSDRQRVLYSNAIGEYRKAGLKGSVHLKLLSYLRRLCSDSGRQEDLTVDSIPLSAIERDSPKMAWLLKKLREIRTKDEKVIIFCEFRDLQRTLQRAIKERFDFNADIINGTTSSESESNNSRQKRIKIFQSKAGFGVIILSPLAVGFGINIQSANHVIHFTRTWNPAKEDQATDRAYRIGQKRDVYVYYPVVIAEDFQTFDAKLDTLLEWKRNLSTDMLNGTGELRPSDFSDLRAPEGNSILEDNFLSINDVKTLDPELFEAFCSILWSKMGYRNTQQTKRSGDGGIDVIAITGKEGVLIQCKSSLKEGYELGWNAVKDVVAGAKGYSAKYPGIKFSLVAITNQYFNSNTRSQASLNHVELIDSDEINERLKRWPIKRSEILLHLQENYE